MVADVRRLHTRAALLQSGELLALGRIPVVREHDSVPVVKCQFRQPGADVSGAEDEQWPLASLAAAPHGWRSQPSGPADAAGRRMLHSQRWDVCPYTPCTLLACLLCQRRPRKPRES